MPATLLTSRRCVVAGGLAAGLAACTTTPLAPALPPVSLARKGAIRFAVAQVDVVTGYAPPLRPPNIDHEIPFQPLETMQRWGRERLAASGAAGRVLRFTIAEAAMLESDLPRETGMRAGMTAQQDKRYDLALAGALELREQPSGLVVASGEARVTRFRTVAEGIPVAEREAVWHALLSQSLEDFDVEIERQIRFHFSPYVL